MPCSLVLTGGASGYHGPGVMTVDKCRRWGAHDVRHSQVHGPLEGPGALELQDVRFQNMDEGTPKLMHPPAQAHFLSQPFVQLATNPVRIDVEIS
jgi:hypothetical protein